MKLKVNHDDDDDDEPAKDEINVPIALSAFRDNDDQAADVSVFKASWGCEK